MSSSVRFKNSLSKVDVFSGKNLTYLYSPDTQGIKKGMESVIWSADGRYLYAGGYPRAISRRMVAPIVKWEDKGLGRRTVMRAGKSAIQDMVALKDGGILFAAYNSGWGAFNSLGERIYYHRSRCPDYRDRRFGDKVFLISADAAQVAFSFRVKGRYMALFNIENRSLEIDPVLGDEFLAPIVQSPQINITDWFMSRTPRLNGKLLKMKEREASLCLSIAPDGNSFILGTEWNLYRFDAQGNQIWKMPTHSFALSTNISKTAGLLSWLPATELSAGIAWKTERKFWPCSSTPTEPAGLPGFLKAITCLLLTAMN